ncbi:MAG: hypothetical protein EHM45_01800 [Desulfobacteraceae bacterium]|nr:MAG: hypothetical protein EHM45_01800 [Desulfobacteraceae bacterium]
MSRDEKIKAYGAWCAICFFWGTTYLAIRVGVQVMQMFIAGIIFMLAGAVLGQYQRFTFHVNGMLAIAYLVVFGSIIGYSSFIYALAKLPAAKVAMYAYVNPVVAVFFGWLILNEPVNPAVFVATAIILLGVVLVNSSRSTSAPGQRVKPEKEKT